MRSNSTVNAIDSLLPERPSIEASIKACSVFETLPESLKDALAAGSYIAFAERGEAIWTAGSPSTFASVVSSGFVKLTQRSAHGKEIVTDLFGPGQSLGLLATIEGRPFALNAIAATTCWYLKIPAGVLNLALRGGYLTRELITRSIMPKPGKAFDWMAKLSSGPVEQRVAAVLLLLADTYGQEMEDRLRLEVPLTAQDVEEMAGTTREASVPILGRWQEEGWVTIRKQMITQLRPDQLEQVMRV